MTNFYNIAMTFFCYYHVKVIFSEMNSNKSFLKNRFQLLILLVVGGIESLEYFCGIYRLHGSYAY